MSSADKTALFRSLPSVDELLRTPEVARMIETEGHAAVVQAARTALDHLRTEIGREELDSSGIQARLLHLPQLIEQHLRAEYGFSLRPVINATGVILHTNLGRAPLGVGALEHLQQTSRYYSNLEFDLEEGHRGRRDVHADRLFRALFESVTKEGATPEPSTIVVNNNAAAVLIALNTLGEGGEVIVSRGELVEIGGSFRIPDVMAKSGAVLREIGTTNRTRLSDYERAINERTRMILRVHRSNFEIVGFTEQPSLESLVQLGRAHGLPVMEDLGSGALFDLRAVGIHGENTVFESLRAGVDLVTYSGDKLLGGPQAGLITGRKEIVAKIRSNPLFRALRADKLRYAALEYTLLAYLKQDYDAIPALRFLRVPLDEIEKRTQKLAKALASSAPELAVEVMQGESVVGGGAAPGAVLPTILLAIHSNHLGPHELACSLRKNDPPVVARVQDECLMLDLRTVFPQQDEALRIAVQKACSI